MLSKQMNCIIQVSMGQVWTWLYVVVCNKRVKATKLDYNLFFFFFTARLIEFQTFFFSARVIEFQTILHLTDFAATCPFLSDSPDDNVGQKAFFSPENISYLYMVQKSCESSFQHQWPSVQWSHQLGGLVVQRVSTQSAYQTCDICFAKLYMYDLNNQLAKQ